MNHGLCRLVAFAVRSTALVMPPANAGAGLPGQRLNVVALPPLYVPYHGLTLLLIQYLTIDHCPQTTMVLGAFVVQMRCNAQTGIGDGPGGQLRIIEVNNF